MEDRYSNEEYLNNDQEPYVPKKKSGSKFAAGFLAGAFSTLCVCVLIVGVMLLASGKFGIPGMFTGGSSVTVTPPESQQAEENGNPGSAAGTQDNAADAGSQYAPNAAEFSPQFEEKISEINEYIDSMFIFPIDQEKMLDEAVKGYVNGLGDIYSAYYTPEEYQETLDDSDGNYVGIGVVVQQDANTNAVKVMNVYPDSPAEAGGMQNEDIIIKVEGEDISTWSLNEVVKAIRGVEGTPVNVTVYRSGEEVEISMIRKGLTKITVESEMLQDHVGYLKLTEFDAVSIEQMRSAVKELQAQGMERMVLDLRDNPGGLLTTVVTLADDFLPQANIFYFKDKAGNRTDYNSEPSQLYTGPMTVLINGNSASASEVLSGTLKDNDRALIVGEQSFGKGIVQSFYPLSDGSGIKLTTSHYFTPDGTDIHGVGIAPDIEIKDDRNTEEDEQLVRAVEEVKKLK